MHIASIAQIAVQRRTTKIFDPARTIPVDKVEALRTLLKMAPSSTNTQPWHFILAATAEGKARVAKSTQPDYPFNTPKLLDASHVVVLCARTALDADYLRTIVEKEYADGRMASLEDKEKLHAMRTHYVNLHNTPLNDMVQWNTHQVYIALGTLLLGAASLELDACPMEGFDPKKMDAEFGLTEKGLTSVAVVALGYRSANDFNSKLPKSRLPTDMLFTEI